MYFGRKANETRSWPTAYRGDLVICSSQHRPTFTEFSGGDESQRGLYDQAMRTVPFGKALCIVELYACVPSDYFNGPKPVYVITELERSLGDYSPGRCILMTRNLRRLAYPIPVRGMQRIFNLTTKEEAAVLANIPAAEITPVFKSPTP